ncbi:D-glycerate dehydrogenase [Novosphingobium sp. FSY-8]|uniref:D-glycerate dehydrogenase n=2 Tax=Novosphingobium ovatum TaxID=1908523 RepID=A0ABW9XC19_9SPHN|nr:D-glycerate dehydrogenase [Novosphingobium ovatum]
MPQVEARMAELFDVVLNTDDHQMDRAELIAAMREADVLVPCLSDRIDRAMLDEVFATPGARRLGLIANFGAGIEHIDLSAARAHKVIVTNTPGVYTDDTADMTMALIISAVRRFAEGVRQLHAGEWGGWAPSTLLGHRIGGRRLAIIGMGRIGQAVAHRARAFGMEVVYHNRHRVPAALENMLGARYEADLDQMIAQADILSLHCPASTETHHILSAARIASMKPDAYVINTARGDLIDEAALIDALENGRLGGAGLDVYTHEPTPDSRLSALPNVVMMPHMGSCTIEGREASGAKVIANIRFWADGHRPPDQVLEGWA